LLYVDFGLLQPFQNKEAWIELRGADTFEQVLAMFVMVGLAAWAGYTRPAALSAARRIPIIGKREFPPRYPLIGLACIAVGVLAYLEIIAASGGWERYISQSRTATNYQEISGYLVNLTTIIPVGLLILMGYTFSRRNALTVKVLVVASTAAYSLWCIYTGARSGVIAMAIIVLGAVWGGKKRNPPIAVILIAAVTVVFFVGFLKRYRGELYGGSWHSDLPITEVVRGSFDSYSDRSETGGLDVGSEFGMALAAAEIVPTSLDFDRGYMLLEIFTRGIPRAIWPDKAYPEGESWDKFHRTAGTSSWVNNAGFISGPAPGLVGKYYYMFGWPGLLFGAAWSGFLLRLLKEYVARYDGICFTLLAVAIANLGFSEMNNPFSWLLYWLPSTGIASGLFVFIARTKRDIMHLSTPPSHEPQTRILRS